MVSLSQSYFKIYNPSSGLLVFSVDPQNFAYIEDILNHQRKFFEDIKTDVKILRVIGYYPRHVKVLGWPDTIILIPRVEVENDTQRTHILLPDFLIKYRMHSVKSFTLATIEITEYDYITEESIPPFYNKTSTSNKIIQRELDEKTAEIIKQILIPPKPIDIRIKKYLMKETSKIDFELYEELQVKPSSKRFLEGNNISTDLFEKFYSIYYIVHGIEDFCKACYRKIQYFNPVFLMKNLGIYDYLLNS